LFNEDPVSVPAAAGTVTSALPSNATPFIFRAVVSVAAEPVVFWFNVGNVQFVSVPDVGVPKTPPFTTGDPADPTFTPKAAWTPVPNVIAACFAFHVAAEEIYASPIAAPFHVPDVIVPTDVRDDPVTPAANEDPVSVPAAAGTVTSALPSNATPFIFRAVVSVAAEPVVFWFSVGNVQFVSVPDVGVPKSPPFTTGAPANPTFTPKAAWTPVPNAIAACFAFHVAAEEIYASPIAAPFHAPDVIVPTDVRDE